MPLGERVRPPERPIDVLVRHSSGSCPLMRKVGDVWRIDLEGRLSAPRCGPSAAAIQRLMKTGGLESGTTARCVCPLGPYELTFMLDAAERLTERDSGVRARGCRGDPWVARAGRNDRYASRPGPAIHAGRKGQAPPLRGIWPSLPRR